MTLWSVVLVGLAAYRATRVFTRDTITDPWRESLYGWAFVEDERGIHPRQPWRTWAYELATCPLCLGVWCSGALYLLWRWGGDVLHGLIVVLAIAGLQCVLATHEPEPES